MKYNSLFRLHTPGQSGNPRRPGSLGALWKISGAARRTALPRREGAKDRSAVSFWSVALAVLLLVGPGLHVALGDAPATQPTTQPGALPRQVGGESQGIVQVANLIYAQTKTSTCFSDHFLIQAEKDSSITTSRRFHSVKLASQELFDFPMVIMTGEGGFEMTDGERQNLRKYIERGGFLVASAGCSSPDWDRCFRAEMARIFGDHPLTEIKMDHPVFHTVYDIGQLAGLHSRPRPLEGVSLGTRLGVLYSVDGLNNTAHATGCCCCGGNEITNCERINVNILAYALSY
jgi:hypothetical protein